MSDRRVPSDLERVSPQQEVGAVQRDEITGALLDPSQPLMWRRTAPLAPHFELMQGNAAVGGMEPMPESEFDAAGECFGRDVQLRLETHFFGSVRVESVSASGEQGPWYTGLFWGWGRIETARGERLRWRHGFTGLYTHVLVDSHGGRLLRMKPTFLRFGRTETKVVVSSRGWARPDLPELILLTWFLRAHTEVRGRRVFRKPRRSRRVRHSGRQGRPWF